MNPTDPVSQMPTSPAPMPEPQPQPVFNSMPEPVVQQPLETKSSPSRSMVGIIGLGIGAISLIALPIIMVNMGSSYLWLLVTVITGALGAGTSIFALKQSEKMSLIALAGFIIGMIVFSISFVDVIQTGVSYEKFKTASAAASASYQESLKSIKSTTDSSSYDFGL